MQCDLRERKQQILTHCCPKSETWCLTKCARYFAGRIKLVGGPDVACGPYFGQPCCKIFHTSAVISLSRSGTRE